MNGLGLDIDNGLEGHRDLDIRGAINPHYSLSAIRDHPSGALVQLRIEL